MAAGYVEAVRDAMLGVLDVFEKLALPLAVLVGLLLVAFALNAYLAKSESRPNFSPTLKIVAGYCLVGLVFLAGWAALRRAPETVKEEALWKESAEATANPTPDSPPIFQYGPVAAALAEKTYSRTLTLPPDFLQKIGAEGVGVLAPYLSDPSAENVIKLVDTFRRSGQDAVFTREVTRMEEQPIPFSSADVKLKFDRLAGRAYDAAFEGKYVFKNSTAETIDARFIFPLPTAGTVRELSIAVGGQQIGQPDERGQYAWNGKLAPNETQTALVRYKSIGSAAYGYELGSFRRRVESFSLSADAPGPVKFMRGSLQPTTHSGGNIRWQLTNVVTGQRVAISFPRSAGGSETFIQAMSVLAASLAVFLIGALALSIFLSAFQPVKLAAAVAVFSIGLAASAVIANYLGPVAGVIIGPLLAAAGATAVLGKRFWLAAFPASLLPATFLSPEHTGLLVLLLFAATAAAALLVFRRAALNLGRELQ